ncbi:SpoIID/LytB domain-containing protein [Rubrobacter naiadicus]|uniref:SpoIID/LytB domain-containing protein n=1 Tax=Rubrobacter naiadicus TaxID=1392641 RepID=UPI002361C8A4|nr:SpoIID/LytB domain-containing protein [Rubrobacter naiadicus]
MKLIPRPGAAALTAITLLASALFTLQASVPVRATTGIPVCGSGYGHGVGLSQYGAYGRAVSGQGYARIVKAYYHGVRLTRYGNNPLVRVLLAKRSIGQTYTIQVTPGSTARLAPSGTGVSLTLGPGDYRVGYLTSKGLYRVTNFSSGRTLGDYRGPIVFRRASGGFLHYGGRSYRGALIVRVSGGSFYLVNRLGLEGYVRGVVPNEMPPSWPQAALEAQAVASRSYARSALEAHARVFDLTGSDERYLGASSETPSTNHAVSKTRGVVATYAGSPIKAFYYSSDGGYTEASSYVFGPEPYLKAMKDTTPAGRPYDAIGGSPWMRWSGTISPWSSPGLGIGAITGVRVLGRSPSGRVTKVEVDGTQGKRIVSGEYAVRYAFSPGDLIRADGSIYHATSLPSARVSFGAACRGG